MTKDEVNYKLIAERIKEFRKAKKISQMKLADLTDLAVQHISNIETGRKKPSLAVIIIIANALEVTADDLLAGNIIYAKGQYNKDVELLLEDCTPYEKRVVTKIMTASKEALRLSEGLDGDPRTYIFR